MDRVHRCPSHNNSALGCRKSAAKLSKSFVENGQTIKKKASIFNFFDTFIVHIMVAKVEVQILSSLIHTATTTYQPRRMISKEAVKSGLINQSKRTEVKCDGPAQLFFL